MKKKLSDASQEKCLQNFQIAIKTLGVKVNLRSNRMRHRFAACFVDYRTQEEGAKHFQQPDILVADKSGQKSEIKRQPDVALAI